MVSTLLLTLALALFFFGVTFIVSAYIQVANSPEARGLVGRVRETWRFLGTALRNWIAPKEVGWTPPEPLEERMHRIWWGLEQTQATLRDTESLLRELDNVLKERAEARAELEEAIAHNETLAAISKPEADELVDEVINRLAPRDRRSFQATVWITAVSGFVFLVLGVILGHVFS